VPRSKGPTARQFGHNLRRARTRLGIPQEELALRAALHRTEIGLLERGQRLPRIDTLIKCAEAAGVSPEELLEGIMPLAPGLGEEIGAGR